MSRQLALTVCAAVVYLVVPLGIAHTEVPVGAGDPAPWEQKIKQVLDQKVAETGIEFIETPLSDAFEILKGEYGVGIIIDRIGLDEVGLSTDAPITANFHGITLRSALRLMLRDLELTYVFKDEVLLITTIERAETELLTRVYPVDDLVKVYPWQRYGVVSWMGSPIPVDGMSRHEDTKPTGHTADHVLCQFGGGVSLEPPRGRAPIKSYGGTQVDFDTLIELILRVIAPESWDEVGGPGSIGPFAPNLIIVSQTQEVHEEIADLLAALRAVPPLHEQEPGEVYPSDRLGINEASETRINKVLDQKVTERGIDLIETPLSDAVAILKQEYDIEITIDRMGLDEVGISTDVPATIDVRDISLRSALRLMFRDLELTYVLKDEVLLITTPEKSETELTDVSYPVGDLVGREYGDDGETVKLDFDSLIGAITATVRAESWDEVGGPGTIEGFAQRGLLVVGQTQEVHEEIADLLAQMRTVRNRTGYKPTAEKPDPAEIVVRRHFWPDGEAEECTEVRNEIEPIIRSIIGHADPSDQYVVFLPNRIVIRHRRDVQIRVQRLLDELREPVAPQTQDLKGSGFGAGRSEDGKSKPQGGGGFY